MKAEPLHEGKRWMTKAEYDLKDAEFTFKGKRYNLTYLPELLAPAGSWDSFRAAVENGADAVYLGGKAFSARSYAANFDNHEVERAVEYAHLRGVRIYVTVNTLLDNGELMQAAEYARFLNNIGVDGIIVQDLGLLHIIKNSLPDMEIHASTQMTIHNIEGAKALEEMGVNRIVLARELSLEEIKEIARETAVDLEVFVHGALCFCYSGQCLMSSLIGGRSGNRGKCAQPCRLKFSLKASDGRIVMEDKHILSPKDLSMIKFLPELVNITRIKALKIEGRMKRPEYVAIVTRAYRRALDRIRDNPECFNIEDEEYRELIQIFSRGFTTGYYHGRPGRNMMSYESGKNRGLLIGKVQNVDKGGLSFIRLYGSLSRGDGIEVWSRKGNGYGTTIDYMEINGEKAEKGSRGQIAGIKMRGRVHQGDLVYKTSDIGLIARAQQSFAGEKPLRKIPVVMEAELMAGKPLSLKIKDLDGNEVTVFSKSYVERAVNKPLTESDIRSKLDRLGNTPYRLESLKIKMDNGVTLPFRELNETRRQGVDLLSKERIRRYTRKGIEYRDFQNRIFPLFIPEGQQTKKKTSLTVRVDSVRGVKIACESGADEIYFGGEGFFGKGFYIGEYREALEIAGKYDKKMYFALPRITDAAQMEEIKGRIKVLKDLKPYGFLASNIGILYELKEYDVNCIADFPLNVFNSLTAKVLNESFNVSRITLSPELRLSQIRDIVSGPTFMELEVIGHGLLPMMVTKHCIIQSIVLGGSPNECAGICKKGEEYVLLDRMKKEFPLWQDDNCHTHIMNCVELMTLEEVPQLVNTGIFSLRIEGRRREYGLAEVIRVYRKVLDMGDEGLDSPDVQKFIESMKTRGYTKGHLLRGVE
ncbi:MAG: peptidase U32 [Firmicutes bacterium]|nr:peptidase U32 [Bacillota bacterium]